MGRKVTGLYREKAERRTEENGMWMVPLINVEFIVEKSLNKNKL